MTTSNLERKFLFFHTNPDGTYSLFSKKFKTKPFFFFGKISVLTFLPLIPAKFLDSMRVIEPTTEFVDNIGPNQLVATLIFLVFSILDGIAYHKIP